MTQPQKTVLVAGDYVLDYHIYEGGRYHFGDASNVGVQVVPQVGGAALIHDLLEALYHNEPKEDEEAEPPAVVSQLNKVVPQTLEERLAVDRSQHAYAFWRPFEERSKHFWRVSEAMGFGAIPSTPIGEKWTDTKIAIQPDVVVLSDGGMGFRQSKLWKKLPLKKDCWIVLKSSAPVAEGPLWEKLVKDHADRLVVVVSSDDLRRSDARISKGLSWDATVKHLLNEMQKGRPLENLTRCRHLFIACGSEGGLWLDFDPNGRSETQLARASFVFDPSVIEGDHRLAVKGTAFGFLSCLTAAIVRQLCAQTPDFELASEGGLSAMRNLRNEGHGTTTEDVSGFPAARLARVIRQPADFYSRARFSVPAAKIDSGWSFLNELLQSDLGGFDPKNPRTPAYELARMVALRGPIALENLPSLRVGKLLSVDRHEIESLRGLLNVMRNYRDRDPGKKPLSLGVFGPPGSGKSFAVKQLAKEICGKEGWLEFNLSQFADTNDLIGAFHQIRDRVLNRILPVAFFDEFDSQKLNWLQYLLAPMQDGMFQEGQITHPIGKCIFIFAGGTSWTFDTFGPPTAADQTDFRLAKGPDFKSRLDGFLDVIGPNQRQILGPDPAHPELYHAVSDDPNDICFPLRRTLMLRSELGCEESTKLDLDDGVLHALLHVEKFEHGSRSLAKILGPFKQSVGEPLYPSLLPPRAVIDMHTDAAEFFDFCEKAPRTALKLATISGTQSMTSSDPLGEPEVELLAPAIHETYNKLGLAAGWLTPEKVETFEELSEEMQNSNRAAARRMVRNLDLTGLVIEPGKNTQEQRGRLARQIEYHLELLAEAEHDGWMKWHFEHSWRYADLPKKDEDRRLHPCLIPYQDLSLKEQEKDRDTIRHYIDFVSMAKRKIVAR